MIRRITEPIEVVATEAGLVKALFNWTQRSAMSRETGLPERKPLVADSCWGSEDCAVQIGGKLGLSTVSTSATRFSKGNVLVTFSDGKKQSLHKNQTGKDVATRFDALRPAIIREFAPKYGKIPGNWPFAKVVAFAKQQVRDLIGESYFVSPSNPPSKTDKRERNGYKSKEHPKGEGGHGTVRCECETREERAMSAEARAWEDVNAQV